MVSHRRLNLTFSVLALLTGCHLLSVPAAAQSNNAAAYTWTTFAGSPTIGSADGAGSNARFFNPSGVAVDAQGNVYVADTGNDTIRKFTPSGVTSTIAGFPGTSGSADGTNSQARFNAPQGIAIDINTNIYVADTGNHAIRKLAPAGTNWVASTLAGLAGSPGTNDGMGAVARFSLPQGIAVNGSGIVYVADTHNYTVRMITPGGVVSTIAGSAGNEGDVDGAGTNARFANLEGIAVDALTNLYVADFGNNAVRKITRTGVVSTIIHMSASAIALDALNHIWVSDTGSETIHEFALNNTNWLSTGFIAGNASNTNASGQILGGYADGTGTNALFNAPRGIAVDGAGNVYVADSENDDIRLLTSAGSVSTIAGAVNSAGSQNGTGSEARFNGPIGLAVDVTGAVFVADTFNSTIRKITSAGVVSTVAGLAGNTGFADGVGSNARFNSPEGIALDSAGDLFVTDTGNGLIRKITPAGTVSTIAGMLNTNFVDRIIVDGTGTNAGFGDVVRIIAGADGALYVTDIGQSLVGSIRKMTLVGTNWMVSTTTARTYEPFGVAMDGLKNLYLADAGNYDVAVFDLVGTNYSFSSQIGVGYPFQGSADGTGTQAEFVFPTGIAVDAATNLFVTDEGNGNIRQIARVGTNWGVTTIGGLAGIRGSADGVGNAARFNGPEDIAVDSAGNVYVADTANNTIRKGVFEQYGAANPVTYSQPSMNAQLVVTTMPAEASGQWRFPWELGWHNSGDVETNLVMGNYPVEFRSLSGYLSVPQTLTVAVTNGGTTQFTNLYYPTLASTGTNSGSLTVNIGPNSPTGSGWRFLGETTWRAPGSTAANLIPDIYFIEFVPVSGRSKPSSQAAQVYAGLPTIISANYLLSQSAPLGVLLPGPVPSAEIGDLTGYPFGFNGQLQSDVGYGSGVAVQTNVVLTAAHLVFNDQTLSYVSQVYWYFQEETGVFQPEPMPARGWYVLSGYATERTNDLESGLVGPDQSTPQSRNLDVAALYFLTPVAGGGYGGYLPSDATPNSWLTGTSLKMLAGYPVDGSQFGDASIVPGQMYQTQPQPYPLSLSTDPVADQQVYVAPWFLSYPGNSGGPLYVQFDGYYYPAGVYLGTLYNGTVPYASAVRAIDSNVVSLITLAQTLGDNGTNNTGGGVITIIPNQAVSASNPGYIQWVLSPPAAVTAGAAWRLGGDTTYSTASNYTRAVFTTNAVTVEFKPITGWNLPTNQAVTVLPGQVTVYTAVYTPTTVASPVLVVNPAVGLGIMGTTNTSYLIQYRTNLTTGAWLPLSTNTILSNGFNLVLPWPPTNGPTAFYRALWLQ